MKTTTNSRRVLFLGSILICIMVHAGCKKEPGDEDISGKQYESGFISSRFSFGDAVTINGKIPESPPVSDLKIDKSKIYLAEGVTNCISIRYPGTNNLDGNSSIYLQVKGSDTYYDIKSVSLRTLDTIGVYCFEFDPADMELPYTFEVVIAPHDASGNVIDRFERQVVIEKESGNCDIYGNQGQSTWRWLYTVESDGEIISPTNGYKARGTTNGCCVDGETVDCFAYNVPESEWRTLEYENIVSPQSEQIVLKSDGSMNGSLVVYKRNIRYQDSDFCGNNAAYSESTYDNSFWGEFTYDQANGKITFRNLASRLSSVYFPEHDIWVSQYDEMYIGNHKNYDLVGCHFLVEEFSGEGGSKRFRWFERIDDPTTRWKD